MGKSSAKKMGGASGASAANFGGLRRVNKRGPTLAEKTAQVQGKTKRGSKVTVKVKQSYGAAKDYTLKDVLKLCLMVEAGSLTTAKMRELDKKGLWTMTYKVPASTLYRWLATPKGSSEPRWRALQEENALPRAGRAPLLGRAEHVLMCVATIAQRAHMPYHHMAIKAMAREMAIQLGAIDPRTKKTYTEESDMTGWYRGFMERCEKKGCSLKVRNGHGMGAQRVHAQSWETVEYYRDQVSSPRPKGSSFHAASTQNSPDYRARFSF